MENAVKEGQRQKELYIEILRMISMFFVIFNHTSNNGFFLFADYLPSQFRFWAYMFLPFSANLRSRCFSRYPAR